MAKKGRRSTSQTSNLSPFTKLAGKPNANGINQAARAGLKPGANSNKQKIRIYFGENRFPFNSVVGEWVDERRRETTAN